MVPVETRHSNSKSNWKYESRLKCVFDMYLDNCPITRGPSYNHGFTLIAAWLSNPSKVWDEITYTLTNCNGCTVEVQEWMSKYIAGIIL